METRKPTGGAILSWGHIKGHPNTRYFRAAFLGVQGAKPPKAISFSNKTCYFAKSVPNIGGVKPYSVRFVQPCLRVCKAGLNLGSKGKLLTILFYLLKVMGRVDISLV